MIIGLIDVDGHNYPNLCLMKLSAYHKAIGDTVEWYDQSREMYDRVYMSKVFSNEYSPDIPEPVNTKEVQKGGTGYAIKLVDGREVYDKELDKNLPDEIEHIYLDYSLYPQYTGYGQPLKDQTAYGFLTRGCPRGCGFCHVAPKEGRCSKKVADLSEFWNGQGNICLSDPNILACKDWRELLQQLVNSNAKIEFNQGLDARLITPEKAELLASMKLKQPHFAMDSMKVIEPVKRGLKLYVDACKRIKGRWNWRNAKVFCLVNFDTTYQQDMQRIQIIQECECYPYVMIYNKPSAPAILRRLQRWTNSTTAYAKCRDFYEYQRFTYKEVLYTDGKEEKPLNDSTTIFDCEVGAKDWLFVFKNVETGEYTVIHNDNDAVIAFMENDPFLGGFNNKHYDNHILKAVMVGCTPEQVKEINDAIIVDEVNGWDIPLLRDYKVFFSSFDLMDDCQMGLSLKAFEAHLGIPIEETEVDFNLDRAWTTDELEKMITYCKYDVDATERLYNLRSSYLENKVTLGAARGLTKQQAMYMTNAKLTSVYLKAVKPEKPWEDEREYQYPDKLLREYIPQEVFDFFDRMHDYTIPSDELFSSKLEIMVGVCPCTIAYGGIHGAIPTYTEEATETRSIRNKDVASYYPHLMTLPLSEGKEYGFCSRNIPSPQVYVDTLNDRVKAKKAGDTATANALKLVLNTTYGAMLNGKDGHAFNDLYDPLMGRSVCITGQLFLLELSEHLIRECPTLKIIQLNTDGIMVSLDNTDEPKWQEITQEWQDRTGFELEEDFIQKIVQKDVNNYVEVPVDGGTPKVKGGQLVRGIPKAGAFNINNNAVVVARAIQQYFVDGTPPEKTIADSTDILDFQLIAKAGGKYTGCYHMVGDEAIPVQKVNRVYATKDTRQGTLYKTHAATGRDAKVAGLPTHCVIDNNNELSIEVVDRKWYVKLAQKYIKDFLGIKPPRKNTRKINSLKKKSLELFN